LKLPGADNVRIDDLKVRGYLLSPSHPVGRFKARFFAALGFSSATADLFVTELRRIAAVGDVQDAEDIGFGRKYTVPGELQGPAGHAQVLTVWIVETGQHQARLVSVHPR
jgi:hypothetical protein